MIPDGLARTGKTVYVVNLASRVTELKLSGRRLRARVVRQITSPRFRFPTTVAIDRRRLLVVNSQFNQRGGSPVLPFTVSAESRGPSRRSAFLAARPRYRRTRLVTSPPGRGREDARGAGLPEIAVETFASYRERLADGERGMLPGVGDRASSGSAGRRAPARGTRGSGAGSSELS